MNQLSDRDLRCRARQVTTDEELRAIGWIAADGTAGGGRAPWLRPDGGVEQVPAGIDPGFAYNPGVDYTASLRPPPLVGPLPVPAITPRPLPPMPEPRTRPASVLLNPETPPDEAVDTFLGHFPNRSAAEAVDRTGQPLNMDQSFFYKQGRGQGVTPKFAMDPERLRIANLLPESILDPDEIWHVWEPRIDRAGVSRWRLVRRYVTRFVIDGKERTYLLVTDYNERGWRGVTAFKSRKSNYRDKDGVRGGVLVYRRS